MSLRTTAAGLLFAPLVAAGAVTLTTGTSAAAASKPVSVTAVETDFHIALSKTSFKPGTYVFVAKNKGHTTHSLEITGPGLHNAVTKDINPGQSTKLTVTFKSGRYDVFCPVPGHKALGMNVNLVVTATSASTSSSKTTQGNTSTGGASF